MACSKPMLRQPAKILQFVVLEVVRPINSLAEKHDGSPLPIFWSMEGFSTVRLSLMTLCKLMIEELTPVPVWAFQASGWTSACGK